MSTLNDLIGMTLNVSQVTFDDEMMQQAAEQLVREKRMKAVESCQVLIAEFNKTLEEQVEILRHLREKEHSQATHVKQTDRAFRFFGDTGNPLPFFAAQNKRADGEKWAKTLNIKLNDEAWVIPAGWQPKQTETK